MSSSSEADGSNHSSSYEFSPPTSPHNCLSPSTSPLHRANDSNSPPTSPLKRKKRNTQKVSRSTLVRRRLGTDEGANADAATGLHNNDDEIVLDISCDDGGETSSGMQAPQRPQTDKEYRDLPSDENMSQNSTSSGADNKSDESTEESSSNGEDVRSSAESSMSSDSSGTEADSDSSDKCSSDSDDSDMLLYDGSELTVNEALLSILKLYMEEKWTKNSLDKCVKLIRRILPEPNEFPSSGKSVLKKLEELTCSYKEDVHIQCSKCQTLMPNDCDKCEECDCDELDKFYSFPVKEQLKHMFEQRNLAAIIDYHRQHSNRKQGHISDVQDGTVYQSVKEELSGPYDVVLLWNTDGAALSGSSNRELWAILATICEIPVRLRAAFMLVLGVYVGTKKPDMNTYLKPFVDSITDLYTNGVTWVHPSTQETVTSRGTAPGLSADAPAKAAVLCHGNHNTKFGCNICEQKCRRVSLTPAEVLDNEAQADARKRKKRKSRFVYQDDTCPADLREGQRMELQGVLAEERGRPRKGVVGNATVSDIPLLDRAWCVCAEYLHLVLLGVVKYFLLKIFFDKKGDYYIGNHIEYIDEMILNMRVPDFVKRLPRGIKHIKYWKGSEFRNFLLFYSLPVFKNTLPDEYFQHWLLLVGAVYILLKEHISEIDIQSAEIMVRSFVRDVGKLYGDKCYTYNVHTMLHLCLLVRRWGPLYVTSAFTFESFNGFMCSHIHGTKNYGKELINNIKIFQSIAVLENKVNAGHQNFPRVPISSRVHVLGKAWNKKVLSEIERAEISVMMPDFSEYEVYNRIKVGSCIYSCRFYDKNKKRSNSYVKFSLGESYAFGQILAFLKCKNDVLCLVKNIQVTHLDLFVHEESRSVIRHLLPFEMLNTVRIIPVNSLLVKLLKIDQYLAIIPNLYEINL